MLRAGAAGWLGGQDGTPLLGRLRRAGGLGVPMSAAANTTDRPPRWGRSATPGATFGLYGNDFGDLRDLRLDDALDARLEGQHGHGAAAAGAHHLHRHHAVLGHIHQLHVAAVHLHGGTDALQRRLDPLTNGVDLAHWHVTPSFIHLDYTIPRGACEGAPPGRDGVKPLSHE